MKQETANMLNRATSSFMIFLTMVLIVNIFMLSNDLTITAFGGWIGIHVGMTFFSKLNIWTAK